MITMKNSLFLKIFGGFCLTIALASAVLLLLTFGSVRRAYIDDQSLHLGDLAELVRPTVLAEMKEGRTETLEPLVRDIGRRIRVRITVFDPGGSVLADSEEEPSRMESHLFRPEVFSALRGEPGRALRRSTTVGAEMLYMSYPLSVDGKIAGALRLSMFMRDIDGLLFGLRKRIITAAVGLMIVVLLIMLPFSRSISGPVREFVGASRKVASGDLEAKVSLRQKGEFADFARSFNAMTSDLKSMFEACEGRREELDSILSSVQDGFLFIDRDDRIGLANERARAALGEAAPEGRFYWEIVRSTRFNDLVRRVKETRRKDSEEVEFAGGTFLCVAAFLPSLGRVVVTLHGHMGSRAAAPGSGDRPA